MAAYGWSIDRVEHLTMPQLELWAHRANEMELAKAKAIGAVVSDRIVEVLGPALGLRRQRR